MEGLFSQAYSFPTIVTSKKKNHEPERKSLSLLISNIYKFMYSLGSCINTSLQIFLSPSRTMCLGKLSSYKLMKEVHITIPLKLLLLREYVFGFSLCFETRSYKTQMNLELNNHISSGSHGVGLQICTVMTTSLTIFLNPHEPPL
jgi:hypothetical protein